MKLFKRPRATTIDTVIDNLMIGFFLVVAGAAFLFIIAVLIYFCWLFVLSAAITVAVGFGIVYIVSAILEAHYERKNNKSDET